MKCSVPGCNAEARTSKNGNRYKKCRYHQSEANRKGIASRAEHRQINERKGAPVDVFVVDYPNDQVYIVRGVIERAEVMPATDGELLAKMARAAQSGLFIAKSHAYKQEDLK